MKEFIEYIVKQLVDNPEAVHVESTEVDERTTDYILKVDNNDIGKVIGKRGNTINALRTLLIAIGAKDKKKAMLRILEPPGREKKENRENS